MTSKKTPQEEEIPIEEKILMLADEYSAFTITIDKIAAGINKLRPLTFEQVNRILSAIIGMDF